MLMLLKKIIGEQNLLYARLLRDIIAVKKQIHQSTHNKLFEKLVAGKSIAVVGNGPQQIDKETGKEIDTHDLVIRFNNFKTAGHEKDYGRRTDIWVRGNGIFETKNRDKPGQFKMIVWKYDKHTWKRRREMWFTAASQSLSGKVVFGIIPEDVISYTRKWLNPMENESPTLGALIINFLVKSSDAKQVDAYGFSFLDAEGDEKLAFHYYDDYLSPSTHNFKAEAKLLRGMLIEGRRLK